MCFLTSYGDEKDQYLANSQINSSSSLLHGTQIEFEAQAPSRQDWYRDQLAQVKKFMYLLYGVCVRFYSTVVEWHFLDNMKEDLIVELTSMVFASPNFTHTVMDLCREQSKAQQKLLANKISRYEKVKPI